VLASPHALPAQELGEALHLRPQLPVRDPSAHVAHRLAIGRFTAARLEVENGLLPAALARLQKVLFATKDHELALVVRLRIARLQIGLGKPDEAMASLAAVEPGAFAGRYAEVRGDALWAKGDHPAALKAYKEAQAALGGAPEGDLLALKIGSP